MGSIRLDIQNQIVAILQTITKDNKYNNDVRLVTRRMINPRDITSYPVLCVIPGPSRKRTIDESMKLYEVTLVFGIVGYVQAMNDPNREGLLSDAAQNLIEDIEDALLADTTMTDQADSEAQFVVVANEEPWLDYDKNIAEVDVGIAVQYTHDVTV